MLSPSPPPEAEAFYQMGALLMQAAARLEYRDHYLCQKASELMLCASRQQPEDVRPWLALSQLMLVYGHFAKAQTYLAQAWALAPDQADLRQLQKALITLQRQEQEARWEQQQANVKALLTHHNNPAAKKWQELTAQVQEQSRNILNGLRVKPGLQHVSHFQLLLEAHQDHLIHFDYLLRDPTEKQPEALKQSLAIYRKQVEHVSEMLFLSRRMAKLHEIIRRDQVVLQDCLPLNSEGLETWLDRCDAWADQLDTLESNGFDISDLIPAYEDLAREVDLISHEIPAAEAEGL